MFLTDFHIHSTFSDGKMTIPEIIDLYGRRGFGAIAITDHICESSTFLGRMAGYLDKTLTPATYPLYLEILKSEAERAWKQYRLVVLPGFELTKNTVRNSRSAHILAVGVSEFIPAEGDATELARTIREKGGLAIAAHPVSTRRLEKQTHHLWNRREELAELFDAWEVASGPHLFLEVLKSPLPKIANGDVHRPHQISSWKTALVCEKKPDAILDAIRRQDLSYHFYSDSLKEPYDQRPHCAPLGRLRPHHGLRNVVVPA